MLLALRFEPLVINSIQSQFGLWKGLVISLSCTFSWNNAHSCCSRLWSLIESLSQYPFLSSQYLKRWGHTGYPSCSLALFASPPKVNHMTYAMNPTYAESSGTNIHYCTFWYMPSHIHGDLLSLSIATLLFLALLEALGTTWLVCIPFIIKLTQ